jgi:hypothetical protein
MDHEQRRQRQQRSPRGNAFGSGGGASSGKHKGGGGGKGGGKKPIKVVYISNPMRVKTSAAGFRALVQELTGRDADPSKYSSDELAGVGGAGAEDATAAAEIDCGVALGFSPGGAAASCDTVVASPSPAAADHLHPDDASAVAAPYGGDDDDDDDDDEDGFKSEPLLDNYTVFSPPTLLYDHHPHSKV